MHANPEFRVAISQTAFRMASGPSLIELPNSVLELIFEQCSQGLSLDPQEVNQRIVKLLHNKARDHERDAASSSTSRDESQDSDISEPAGHGETFMRPAQLRAAQHARDCREAIHTLSQLSVIITNEAEAAAQLPTIRRVPGLQASIGLVLQRPFVPRRVAWHLACSCRSLREVGVSLPLLQPLVLKLAIRNRYSPSTAVHGGFLRECES